MDPCLLCAGGARQAASSKAPAASAAAAAPAAPSAKKLRVAAWGESSDDEDCDTAAQLPRARKPRALAVKSSDEEDSEAEAGSPKAGPAADAAPRSDGKPASERKRKLQALAAAGRELEQVRARDVSSVAATVYSLLPSSLL